MAPTTAPTVEPLGPDDTGPVEDLNTTQTAALVRAALRAAFPGVKFSVRSERYSLGSSVEMYWTDGPTPAAVEAVTDAYRGVDFDGMQDANDRRGPRRLTQADGTARLVTMGAHYVNAHRTLSPEYAAQFEPLAAEILGEPFDAERTYHGEYATRWGAWPGHMGAALVRWLADRDALKAPAAELPAPPAQAAAEVVDLAARRAAREGECRKARRRPIPFDCKLGAGHAGECSPYTLPPRGRYEDQPAFQQPPTATDDAQADGEPAPMRTVGDFRAALTFGSLWHVTDHRTPRLGGPRRITRNHGRTFDYTGTFTDGAPLVNGGQTYHPRAEECRVAGDLVHFVSESDPGRVLVTWRRIDRPAGDLVPAEDVKPGAYVFAVGQSEYGDTMTVTGYIASAGRVKATRRRKRTGAREMVALYVTENPGGWNGWRTTVYVDLGVTVQPVAEPRAAVAQAAPKPAANAQEPAGDEPREDTPAQKWGLIVQAGGFFDPSKRQHSRKARAYMAMARVHGLPEDPTPTAAQILAAQKADLRPDDYIRRAYLAEYGRMLADVEEVYPVDRIALPFAEAEAAEAAPVLRQNALTVVSASPELAAQVDGRWSDNPAQTVGERTRRMDDLCAQVLHENGVPVRGYTPPAAPVEAPTFATWGAAIQTYAPTS